MTTKPDAEPTAASRPDDTSELETQVALMARIRTCWSPSFSPDGRTLAFISDLNGVPQVWTVPVEGGWPTLVTPLDDQIVQVAWSPNVEWLAFGLAPGGGLNEQVYLVRSDGTGLRRLTEGGKDNNWLGRWTHDGRALDISSSLRDPAAMDSYLVDAQSGDWRLVAGAPLCEPTRERLSRPLGQRPPPVDSEQLFAEKSAGSAPQLTVTNGCADLDPAWWMARASTAMAS